MPEADSEMDDKLIKQLHGPLPDIVADLVSYRTDLQHARRALKRVATSDLELRGMLWHYAVVAYARVFATGVRATFDKAEYRDGLTAANREMHDRVLEERNRYVAHSVDNREAAAMVYLVADENKTGKREYVGVGTMAARYQLLSSNPADEFLRLLDEAEEAFNALIAELSEAVDLQLRSLSLDQLYAVPNLSVRARSVPRRRRVGEKPKERRASDGETASPSIWVDFSAVPRNSDQAQDLSGPE